MKEMTISIKGDWKRGVYLQNEKGKYNVVAVGGECGTHLTGTSPGGVGKSTLVRGSNLTREEVEKKVIEAIRKHL